jgi:hypothetical protein
MNDPFSNGLLQMANYFGNIILPIMSGLMLCFAVYAYSTRKNGKNYFNGGVACLMISGILRNAEYFFVSYGQTGSGMYAAGLLNLVNWVANVIMPLYAVFCFSRAVLSYGGILDIKTMGDDWLRYVLSGFGCLGVSGMVRLLEYFVVQGTNSGGKL